MPTTIELASPWLQGRTFASWQEEFDRRGYLIFERVLAADRVTAIRTALAPFLERGLKGFVGQVIQLPRRSEDRPITTD